jgi:1-deoxy-D-xylulose-5-phosphate synthase
MSDEKIIDRLSSPHQLRRLDERQLAQLSTELRERIIDVVSRRGGHLASNLGVIELTIALHYVFDFSHDKLLWDVGHQCYAHKIITGRGGQFDMLRQAGGISGFPSPAESPYDLFATGHAGTAISTATGLAWADGQSKHNVVAVVGDASIVNGVALEGINNAALLNRQLLIILNDNSMAIDRTRGAMAHVLDRVRMTTTYSGIKQGAEQMLQRVPLGQEISGAIKNIKAGLKTTIHGDQVFEALGFEYFGPIDGHDIAGLIRILRRMAEVKKPVLLHVHTQKGRGAQYAVEDPCRFHSPSAYTIREGKAVFPDKQRTTWTQAFGDVITELGRDDQRIVAITAAMADGAGLGKFRKEFPARYIDVGISESHAVAMAGGLAKAGMRPIVAVYSTFMQRAFDQVFQEACLQDLPVIFCMDRSGLVGSDGAVHHGFSDIATLRTLPGMTLMAPADKAELKSAMQLALSLPGPSAIRYPRDEVSDCLGADCPAFELGQARIIRGSPSGDLTPAGLAKVDAAFLCYGAMVEPALEAADILQQEGIAVAVISARFAKPLDTPLIGRLIALGKPVLCVEDHSVIGGFGSAVMELASSRGLNAANVRIAGLADRFIGYASRQQQLSECGLDETSLADALREMIRHPSDMLSKRYR